MTHTVESIEKQQNSNVLSNDNKLSTTVVNSSANCLTFDKILDKEESIVFKEECPLELFMFAL